MLRGIGGTRLRGRGEYRSGNDTAKHPDWRQGYACYLPPKVLFVARPSTQQPGRQCYLETPPGRQRGAWMEERRHRAP